MSLTGKVIVYSGAAGYLGREAAQAFAAAGAHLALVDVDQGRLESLRAEIERQFPGCRCNVYRDDTWLDAGAIDKMLADVERTLGSVDTLILSAYPRTSDWHLKFESIPQTSLFKNLQDHLGGYLVLAQRAAIKMMGRRCGNIVFFGSIYGLVGPDFGVYEGLDHMTMPAAYAAIKGGISNYTRYLASYLGPYGIRVNCICPGGVKDQQNPSFIAKYEAKVPLRRMATVQDIVKPLMFLVSDDSAYVTGVNLPVDGGWTAI